MLMTLMSLMMRSVTTRLNTNEKQRATMKTPPHTKTMAAQVSMSMTRLSARWRWWQGTTTSSLASTPSSSRASGCSSTTAPSSGSSAPSPELPRVERSSAPRHLTLVDDHTRAGQRVCFAVCRSAVRVHATQNKHSHGLEAAAAITAEVEVVFATMRSSMASASRCGERRVYRV